MKDKTRIGLYGKISHDYYYTAEGYLVNRWWLRTLGISVDLDKIDSNRVYATYVDELGKIQLTGSAATGGSRSFPVKEGVRPVLYISIK